MGTVHLYKTRNLSLVVCMKIFTSGNNTGETLLCEMKPTKIVHTDPFASYLLILIMHKILNFNKYVKKKNSLFMVAKIDT
jgi:hypothetical protein